MLHSKSFWLTAGLVPVVVLAWWLGAPLLIDKTVDEQFPFAATALVPDNMTLSEIEQTMAGMAKLDQETSEDMPDEMVSAQEIKSGNFRDADSFHLGSGRASIYRLEDGSQVLRLEDFRVTNGPDLRVLLASHPDPSTRADLNAQGYIELGKLKGNIGNQNYDIPASVDVMAQMSVVIYCKPFHVVFSVAPLQDVVADQR